VIKILWFILLILTAMIVVNCAHPVTPSGGPKDVTPPIIIETIPEKRKRQFRN